METNKPFTTTPASIPAARRRTNPPPASSDPRQSRPFYCPYTHCYSQFTHSLSAAPASSTFVVVCCARSRVHLDDNRKKKKTRRTEHIHPDGERTDCAGHLSNSAPLSCCWSSVVVVSHSAVVRYVVRFNLFRRLRCIRSPLWERRIELADDGDACGGNQFLPGLRRRGANGRR